MPARPAPMRAPCGTGPRRANSVVTDPEIDRGASWYTTASATAATTVGVTRFAGVFQRASPTTSSPAEASESDRKRIQPRHTTWKVTSRPAPRVHHELGTGARAPTARPTTRPEPRTPA